MNTCNHCNGSNLRQNVVVEAQNSYSGDVSAVGLSFNTPRKTWLSETSGTAPVLADICGDCGTVRFHVADPDKDWVTSAP